ncbi:MAG: DUF1080 domain-containing protein [Planctomycetota bacterium]|jgi:hypothetical protein|nr:DUF1080 domain-containing protein [Planctomycetota bacterium]MDP6990242.1 DUF1080 domain-containing protein [Planctomycetota bacterium]
MANDGNARSTTMSRSLFAGAALTALGLAAPAAAGDEEFTDLFNGEDLRGWWGAGTEDPRGWQALDEGALAAKRRASLGDIAAHWRVEDGVLINDGEGLFLTSERQFEDFELLLDYKTVAGADSGIYLRGCPQVQIWDTTEAGGKWKIGADKGSGGLWNNSPGAPGKDPLVKADRAFGEWNAVRIVMVGSRVSVWLNGKLVVDHAVLENYFGRARPVPRRGPIQLQTHGGQIRWRGVRLREIDAEEANAILRAGGPERDEPREAFEALFDGASLAGWKGATDGYEIVDGALACKAGSGGNLFHERVLGDCTLELEIQLPPGGNNGLALRYPGAGNPAYAGMCELQVLENTHPKYAELDPRQYHGSAYGQVAAERGYQRAVGAWNHQRVTLSGHRITVELNGTPILDHDISTVEELMGSPDHYAGRLRTSGHFGFAGHGDPVRFRRIGVREAQQGD